MSKSWLRKKKIRRLAERLHSKFGEFAHVVVCESLSGGPCRWIEVRPNYEWVNKEIAGWLRGYDGWHPEFVHTSRVWQLTEVD
jgi:hypothetical protein